MLMKNLILLIFIISIFYVSAQENNLLILKESLSKIETGNFKGILINNNLIEEVLDDYIYEANKRGITVTSYIKDLDFIIIEPKSNTPRQLTEFNLGKVDENRNLILLSRVCLVDFNILEATLFRELSHYIGVPYEIEGHTIMSLNKPELYTYSWLSKSNSHDIREVEYNRLFEELKKYINKRKN